MADRTQEVKVPGLTSILQLWQELLDGNYAPVVTGPSDSKDLTIANGAAVSEAFDMSAYGVGSVTVPAVWTAANIGFQVCDTLEGTYTIACDDAGVPLQIAGVATGKSKTYAIPVNMFSAKYVKLWSKHLTAATEDDVNQAAARAMKVTLK